MTTEDGAPPQAARERAPRAPDDLPAPEETPAPVEQREPAEPAHRAPGPQRAKPKRSFLRELPGIVITALVISVLIKTFLVQAFYIPSGSMENTLLVNDRVLVNKLTDKPDEIKGEHSHHTPLPYFLSLLVN